MRWGVDAGPRLPKKAIHEGDPRRGTKGSGAAWRTADIDSRDVAFAPHRLDCGLRPLADSPLKGRVILERLMQASYHSPLEGESQKLSR